jgi:ATP-dependent Clp protease protease subunit
MLQLPSDVHQWSSLPLGKYIQVKDTRVHFCAPSLIVKASLLTDHYSHIPSPSLSARMMPDEPNEEPKQPRTPPRAPPLPTVDGQSGQLDVISRLLKDRILLLGTDVNDEVANVLVAQLLYLANNDPDKDITLYINSPGGSVSAGLAIYDTMQFIPCDVQTVCFGMAASMGAFLLGAGTPGKRKSLPNARIMIHQPLGGAQGAAADIEIQAKEILFVKACLNKYMAEYCGQPEEKIAEDTDRDFFMTPYEALDYGLIDEVIKTKTSHIPTPKMPMIQ